MRDLKADLTIMTEEKERCRKLAVDWALKADGYRIALERCENMKLAREFEELLQTTSIPIAVEKVRSLQVENAKLRGTLKKAIANIKPHHTLCINKNGCNYISAVTKLPDCLACDDWEWAELGRVTSE